jgi:hypothetical protein
VYGSELEVLAERTDFRFRVVSFFLRRASTEGRPPTECRTLLRLVPLFPPALLVRDALRAIMRWRRAR